MRIDIVAMDGLWLAAESWRLSREEWVNYPWDEVYTTDCPATEMPSAVLHFADIMMIEREILASARGHVMWARTSVEHPIEYVVPAEVEHLIDKNAHDLARQKMREMKDLGLHRDEWRRLLPLSATTSLVMRISFRDLVKYALYFDYLIPWVNTYGKLTRRFEVFRDHLLVIIDKFTGSRDKTMAAMRTMKLAKFLYEGDVHESSIVETHGHYIANFEVPLWIRAHMVRHRPLSIVDNFYQIMMRDEVLDLPINIPVRMEIAATKDFWMTIISKRTCWLLQTTLSAEKDPWQSLINSFGDFGQDVLPCADGTCPYDADAYLRITDYDPSVPCPIHLKLRGMDKTPWVDEMRVAAKGRSKFWMDIIEAP